ncbi:putative alcohol O-acetyltransferase [Helianthus annuus]|nr:putative alcohol O-acetyltransferase [Helianthus annuus]KAJ0746463.1 putative alcohol O-acetyltransferase [Helianthus annuus]KAJ0749469.1 putative alcohol O-acetyltransferase [Helianthus annuus]KAJ0921724.1 putative alcohol O-acetyltransferase [Helianthus annuus]
MGSCGTTFSVSVKKRDIIAAALPVQDHWLPMSNLDLLLPPLDVGVFFCYKNSLPLDESVAVVKKSLAQALAQFYPLAGEVVQNNLGEPELLCNNRGVDFIHAHADMELKNIDLHHPDESVERKLVPLKKQGVLVVQVTELRCGGLVIGCSFDHRVADAYSINIFLTAWAEIAQSKPISSLPSFRRSMLIPRHPPIMNTFYDKLFLPLSSLPPPRSFSPINPLISRIYYMEAKDISLLQSKSSFNGNPKRSKLVSFTAFLWKIMAECEDGLNTCKMGVVVNGRERLDKVKFDKLSLSSTMPCSMQNYFGNVLSIPYGEASSSELKEMPLSRVADMVHEFACPAMTEEHFRGLIDWVELHRPEPAVAKIYVKMDENDGEAIVVSSGQRFPVDSIDFGWGKPQFGSYHFPWGGQTGYVMPMPSTRKNGDWIVYMHLLEKHLDLVETKGMNVFKPLTPSYLEL